MEKIRPDQKLLNQILQGNDQLLFNIMFQETYARNARIITDKESYLLYMEKQDDPIWLWEKSRDENEQRELNLLLLNEIFLHKNSRVLATEKVSLALTDLAKTEFHKYVLLYKQLNIYLCKEPQLKKKSNGFLRVADLSDLQAVLKHRTVEFNNSGEQGRNSADIEETVRQNIIRKNTFLWIGSDHTLRTIACIVYRKDNLARIEGVYTVPGYRGYGYAAMLLYEISVRMLLDGRQCILYTDAENQEANHCYINAGFEKIGWLNGIHFVR